MKNIKKPHVIVLRTAGTNCDKETVFAFERSGAKTDLVHINSLFKGDVRLSDYHILAVPGGFTYGDDIMSGRILANEMRLRLGEDLKKFINDGKLMIGICNGFQVFVRAGILPGILDQAKPPAGNGDYFFSQTVTLTYNDSGKFEDRWVHLKVCGNSVWTRGLKDMVYFPVAHAEGKFVAKSPDFLKKLCENGQIAFRYCNPQGGEPGYPEDPNGSQDHIAGMTDKSGRILGLMPHPERSFLRIQHPFWTRGEKKHLFAGDQAGDGAAIFENGVRYVREHLI